MKKIILIIICLPTIVLGQGWEKTYGGNEEDRGFSAQETTDGGYIISGYTESFGNNGYVYLIKTDGNGNELWSKTLGENSDQWGLSVQQTTDGGYIVTGWTELSGIGTHLNLIKTDANGNELWNKTFGNGNEDFTAGASVQQTSNGGYIVAGYSEVNGNGNNTDVYLIKTDANGNEIWSKTFGGIFEDIGSSVQQTSDGGYVVTGTTRVYIDTESETNFDVYLIKTDGNGNELWNKTFGGDGTESGESVQQTSDGGYVISGGINGFGEEVGSIYLIKTDGNGNELWNKTFGEGFGSSVQQTTDGGYIVAGYTLVNGDSYHVYLIKTDGNGNELWTKSFVDGIGYSVQQTSDGGYIIGGTSASNNMDFYLIKTNQFGNITSTFEIPIPNPNRELEKIVNIKGQEINPLTNTPIIKLFNDGSVEKKFIIE